MEDVVAVEVLAPPERHYFLTWGRVFDPVNGGDLLGVVGAQLGQYGVDRKIATSRVCATLQEAAQAPYFFEGFMYFCHRPIPYGDEYDRWKTKVRSEMEEGRGVYYLGAV
jgi:hypothetical protein